MKLLKLFGKKEKKTPKPGELTSAEKYWVYANNSSVDTWDSDLISNAKKMPKTFLEREEQYKKEMQKQAEIQRKTNRFRSRPKNITSKVKSMSPDYGTGVQYLEKKSVSDFLADVGIDPTARGVRRKRSRRAKKSHKSRTRKSRKPRK